MKATETKLENDTQTIQTETISDCTEMLPSLNNEENSRQFTAFVTCDDLALP